MADSLRAVLWDLDGTLVDSEHYHWLAWLATMDAEGIPLTRAQFQTSFGRRNATFLPEWLGTDAGEAEIQRIADRKEAYYRDLVRRRGCSALPGAVEWVKRLGAEGWPQGIASSAPRLNVEAVLEALQLQGWFQAIVAAEDVAVGKPDPDVFLVTAGRLGVPPERCIVVEDAAAGIEAAHRAGMRCIAVDRAGRRPEGDLVVTSLAELPLDAFSRLLAGIGLAGNGGSLWTERKQNA
jgi:beta-phosphoglucomutase family hydrolase